LFYHDFLGRVVARSFPFTDAHEAEGLRVREARASSLGSRVSRADTELSLGSGRDSSVASRAPSVESRAAARARAKPAANRSASNPDRFRFARSDSICRSVRNRRAAMPAGLENGAPPIAPPVVDHPC
jgi:hypothetical protein